MNKHIFLIFPALILLAGCHSSKVQLREERELAIDTSGVPLGSLEESSLKGLEVFRIFSPITFTCNHLGTQVQQLLREEFEDFGDLIKISHGEFPTDSSGMPVSTFLGIEARDIFDSTGKQLPLTRARFYISTWATLRPTQNENAFLNIWSISTYIEGVYIDRADEKLLQAMRMLIRDFKQNFRSANPEQTKRPIIYCYF